MKVYARTREKAISEARKRVWEYFSKEDGRITYKARLREILDV
jgi:hypothetical protein